MNYRNLAVICGVAFAMAGCKGPSLTGEKKDVVGPPPQAPAAAAAIPAPKAAPAATAQGPSVPACDCAPAASKALPTSIHAASPAPARARQAATVQRVSMRGHRTAPTATRSVRAQRSTSADRSHNDTTGDDYAAGATYARRDYGAAYEESYESEHVSESYQSGQHAVGYAEDRVQSGDAGGVGYGYGEVGGYWGAREYTVSRSTRGDVQRSRAQTRVRCGC